MRQVSLIYSWLCTSLLLSPFANGQSPSALLGPVRAPAEARHASAPDPQDRTPARDNDQRLKQLLAAQQAALGSGDAATIASTSQALMAFSLRELARIRLLEGKPGQAVPLFQQSVALDPGVELELELASALLRSGDAAAAATAAGQATRLDPQSASAWAVLGSSLRASRQERPAVDAFSRSLQIHANAQVAYALGSTLLALHEKAKADRIFEQILQAADHAAIWYVEVGDAYREAGYLPEAIRSFKEAIARDPKTPHAQFFLGLTYLQSNQWGPSSESFQHLREAVRLAPHDYVSNFYLGALESTDGSDLPSSDRHLHAAAEADPRQPETWLYLGLNANREHNTAAAETYLRKAIELTGTDESRNHYQVRQAYFALGRILIAQGKRDEGTALLAKYTAAEQAAVRAAGETISEAGGTEAGSAKNLSSLASSVPAAPAGDGDRSETGSSPVVSSVSLTAAQQKQLEAGRAQLQGIFATSANDLGTAQARQHQYAAALSSFQAAEKWDSADPPLERNLGIAAFRTSDYLESTRALGRYFELQSRAPGASANPASSDERIRLMLAISEFSLGRYQAAAGSFAQAQQATMADPRAAYSWASALAHTGQAQEANRIANALEGEALAAPELQLVCHLYVETENYKGSETCYRKVAQLDPQARLAHYGVAEALIRQDRAPEAIAELKQELALSPDDPNVQYEMAYALLQTSAKPQAKALLSRITAAHPEQAEAQYQLGKLLLEEGETGEAINHLEASERANASPDYVHYQLGTAYRKAGRIADADRELKVYRDIKDRKREAAGSHGSM